MYAVMGDESLARAIGGDNLFLDYQPKIALADGNVIGFEGLVRMRDAQDRVLMPAQLIPMAEGAGLIDHLTEKVVDVGLRDTARLRTPGSDGLSVNLAGCELRDPTVAGRLNAACAGYGIAAERLTFEVNEATAEATDERRDAWLDRLSTYGFRLSIDDFGVGFSSLSRLARYPYAELKIDRSFVARMRESEEAFAIVKSTIDLAHNFGLRAAAEGVEDAATLAELRALGCDSAQGYYIAKPLGADRLESWMNDWQTRRGNVIDIKTREPRPAVVTSREARDAAEQRLHTLSQIIVEQIHPIWNLGRKSLIAWRPVPVGIEVLMVPYHNIVDHFSACQRLWQGRRLMGDGTFATVRELVEATPTTLYLPFPVNDDAAEAVATEAVEQVLRRYGITETQHRAVGLFDIVGFSKVEPRQQVAQLNSLECSINTAHGILQGLGRSIDLARTTTGDGFYIWNREKGPEADLETYLLTMLTLADNAIAARGARPEMVPSLRTCFSIGPHYSYYQVEGLDPRGHDYIVGNVTIALARMAGKCQPGQVLIGDFHRPLDAEAHQTTSMDFVAMADAVLSGFGTMDLQGRTVTDIRCYLTGRPNADHRFEVQRYRIQDKHGFAHHVFNQKFNVHMSTGGSDDAEADALFLGLRHTDLDDFDAMEATTS